MPASQIHVISAEGIQSWDTSQGIPPGWGRPAVPHTLTFQGSWLAGRRALRPSDEALRHSRENAAYMLQDPVITECLEQRQRSTALLDWHIEVEDEDDPRQAELRDTLTVLLKRTPYFVKFRMALLNAIWFGRYAVSNRYGWIWINGRPYIGIIGWLPVHGDKLVWQAGCQDDEQEGLGLRVSAAAWHDPHARRWLAEHQGELEPADWSQVYWLKPHERQLLIVHKHMIEDGEFEDPLAAGRVHGVGIRSRIYWCWYQKQECLAWLMEFLERSAFGLEIWYYPWGNEEAERSMRRAAQERIGQGRNIVLVPRPMGQEGMMYGVERIEPGMGGASALKEILAEYFGHQIKRYILGQTLTSEAHATGLGSNLASIHLDTYMQIIRFDARNLEETLTRQLVRRLVEWNWPELRDIEVRFVIETDTPDVEERLRAWRTAWEMGCRLREKDVMELIGAAIPGENDRVLQNPQFAQAEQVQQAGLGEIPQEQLPFQRQHSQQS